MDWCGFNIDIYIGVITLCNFYQYLKYSILPGLTL